MNFYGGTIHSGFNDSRNSFGGFRGVDDYNFQPDIDRGFITRAHTPLTTVTSVLALSYEGGVVMAADLVGSYGSLMRFKNCPRIMRVNANVVIGASGDYADFQYLQQIIKQKIIEEECLDDGISIKPRALFCWLTRVLYQRRSKFDPLWNTFVIAGLQDGQPYISCVDKLGTGYEDKQVATGFGSHLATPLFREAVENKPLPSKEEAIAIVKKSLEILFYRDARSFDKYLLATVDSNGAVIEEPQLIKPDWSLAALTECP